MESQIVSTIEKLCHDLYNPTSAPDRYEAERTLARSFSVFSETPLLSPHPNGTVDRSPPRVALPFAAEDPVDCMAYCQSLLNHSESPYVQMFSSLHMRALISSHFTIFPTEQKLALRNFVLTYMGTHPRLPAYITAIMTQIFCYLTKLGWWEDMEFRKISSDLSSFLAATLDHRIMGLNCLAMLIVEMNTPAPSKNFNRHRRTNIDFRDFELLRSCEIAFSTVRDLVQNPIPYESGMLLSYV
jgi:hypothetical protein